jgi:hypothetical protein
MVALSSPSAAMAAAVAASIVVAVGERTPCEPEGYWAIKEDDRPAKIDTNAARRIARAAFLAVDKLGMGIIWMPCKTRPNGKLFQNGLEARLVAATPKRK